MLQKVLGFALLLGISSVFAVNMDSSRTIISKNKSELPDKVTPKRSKESMLNMIRIRQGGLKYLLTKYNKNGEIKSCDITVTMVVDSVGTVLYNMVRESTCKNVEFENEVLTKIKNWNFGKCPNVGNTEATIKFGFNAD